MGKTITDLTQFQDLLAIT